MAELRFPAMVDVSYESGGRRSDRGSNYTDRHAFARSLKFEERKRALQQAVEFEVVPRLLLAHYDSPPAEAHRRGSPHFSDAVNALAAIVLGSQHEQARGYVQERLDQNISLEDIYLHCIAPAARCLKQLWEDDERDFAQVTLGLWRLQQLLRDFGGGFRREAAKPNGRRVLLALGPGAAQDLPFRLFSLVLSSEFFCRDGWQSWIEPESTGNEIIALVRSEWFDVIEVLIGNEKRLDATAKRIHAIRSESLNRSACIAIAGLSANAPSELVASLGGDVVAANLNDAQTRNRYLTDTPKSLGE